MKDVCAGFIFEGCFKWIEREVSTNKTAVSKFAPEINNTSVHKMIFLWGVVSKVEAQS